MSTQEAPEPYSCKVSGAPLVRKITFVDSAPLRVDEVPVHVLGVGPRCVLFDGEPAHVPLGRDFEVLVSGRDGTKVVLYAFVDDVAPGFKPSDPQEGHYSPAAIGGRVFLAPAGEPWELTDDGLFVRCVVYVREVEVR